MIEGTMSNLSTINFKQWIDENRHLLKPPVGNRQIWKETKDFIVMVVGGPNQRTDYHYNETEEFFYQLEGNIVLRVIDEGKPVDIPIRAGDIFLLPGKVPHSPRREAGSIGIVIERVRQPGMTDGLQWYCLECEQKLYEEYFAMSDIANQMQPVFERFYASEALRTCKHCGAVHPVPAPVQA
jgi:3-hydroxyanthranilate 3,4-dioxygenase